MNTIGILTIVNIGLALISLGCVALGVKILSEYYKDKAQDARRKV
jgi:hypothetical protein